MLGCFILCNSTISSYTIFSLPFTFFLSMILIANLCPAHSASRTIPYVPAPNVRPNRYWALEILVSRHAERKAEASRTSYRSCLAGRTACSSCWRLLEARKVSRVLLRYSGGPSIFWTPHESCMMQVLQTISRILRQWGDNIGASFLRVIHERNLSTPSHCESGRSILRTWTAINEKVICMYGTRVIAIRGRCSGIHHSQDILNAVDGLFG